MKKTHRKVQCSENNRIFELLLPKDLACHKIRIDGELINDQSVEKCDYAITVQDDKNKKTYLFYIELKGHDLTKAIAQLESTINLLSHHFNDFKNKQAHAVCSRIIPFMHSSGQTAIVRFQKRYGFLLKWHSQKAIVVIKE